MLMISVVITTWGQKNWEEKFNGLVITHDNVVVNGYLKFEAATRSQGRKILLLKKPTDNPQIFYTHELKGYVYKNDTFRIIHNLQPFLDENKVIERAEARIAQKGKLILYEIPEIYYTHIFLGPSTPGIPGQVPIAYETFISVIQNSRGELIGIKKENFKEEMHRLLSDAPDILERIDNKVLKFRDLEKIVKEYNLRF